MILVDSSVWIDYFNGKITRQTNLLDKLHRDMVGKELAIQSVGNYRMLRKKGVTVRKTIDMIIATFCVHYGISLLHDDRDFDPMVTHLGLEIV